MTLNEYFVAELKQSFEFLKMTVADLSDADLLTRPVPAANHANWQIGHLILAESGFIAGCGASMPELPAGFKERYSGKETAKIDDPARFAKKDDLLALFQKVRNATIEFVRTLPPERFADKGPMDFVPTVASVFGIASGHIQMHVGQIQVLRRKLGKPILF